jgi:hypothetical protein
MNQQEYVQKHQSGFWKERYSTYEPMTKKLYNTLYSFYCDVFFNIYASWQDIPYFMYQEVKEWMNENGDFLINNYNALIYPSSKHTAVEDLCEYIFQITRDMDEEFNRMVEEMSELHNEL